MYNWVPQADTVNDANPYAIPETPAGNPLMTLPRYWSTDARDNIGELPAQVACAALLTDYILTVSVSISSGVAQIVSAYPFLFDYRVYIAVSLVVLIMLIGSAFGSTSRSMARVGLSKPADIRDDPPARRKDTAATFPTVSNIAGDSLLHNGINADFRKTNDHLHL